jgi:hypothetical protein
VPESITSKHALCVGESMLNVACEEACFALMIALAQANKVLAYASNVSGGGLVEQARSTRYNQTWANLSAGE